MEPNKAGVWGLAHRNLFEAIRIPFVGFHIFGYLELDTPFGQPSLLFSANQPRSSVYERSMDELANIFRPPKGHTHLFLIFGRMCRSDEELKKVSFLYLATASRILQEAARGSGSCWIICCFCELLPFERRDLRSIRLNGTVVAT